MSIPDAWEANMAASGSKPDPKDAIISALLELAGERHWEDIPLTDVATRANVSLSTFRDLFPSKGAVLAAFLRKIDKIVLDGTTPESADEPAKERLIAVLRRRLDALTPYKVGLEGIHEWSVRDPFAAIALNKLMINSMRFMLEAAGSDSEGPIGALKLQGLVIAWRRVMRTWFSDDDPDLAATIATLDRELTRGGRFIAHAEDLNRLTSPLFSIARALFERRHSGASSRFDEERDERHAS
jgi:AcrR family transcriptional regulator